MNVNSIYRDKNNNRPTEMKKINISKLRFFNFIDEKHNNYHHKQWKFLLETFVACDGLYDVKNSNDELMRDVYTFYQSKLNPKLIMIMINNEKKYLLSFNHHKHDFSDWLIDLMFMMFNISLPFFSILKISFGMNNVNYIFNPNDIKNQKHIYDCLMEQKSNYKYVFDYEINDYVYK